MSKLLRQNVDGTDYTMAGCALSATCATAAATAAKVAELTDGDVLADGMSVTVQFTNGNTAASPLTLTVGGVTANICDSRGQNIGGNIWQAGNVVTFLYTFGKFLLLNCVVDEVTLNNMNSVTSNAVASALNSMNAKTTYSFRFDQQDFASGINQVWAKLAPHIYQVSGNFIPTRNIEAEQKALLLPQGFTVFAYTSSFIYETDGPGQKLVFLYDNGIEFKAGASANVNYGYNFIIVTNEP